VKHAIYEEHFPVMLRCPLCNADVGSVQPGTRGVGRVGCRGCGTLLLLEFLELECRLTPVLGSRAPIE
jgi:hypothetical protein